MVRKRCGPILTAEEPHGAVIWCVCCSTFSLTHPVYVYNRTCVYSAQICSLSKRSLVHPTLSYTPQPPWLQNWPSAAIRHYTDVQLVADRMGKQQHNVKERVQFVVTGEIESDAVIWRHWAWLTPAGPQVHACHDAVSCVQVPRQPVCLLKYQ